MKPLIVRKILVPVDFSTSSLNALKMATAIAVTHGACIHLLHVTDNDYDLFETGHKIKPLQFKETVAKLGALATAVINEHSIKCFYTSEYGAVTHSIIKTGINLHADLIVMGKNGANGPCREYAGTHTCQVTEKSMIPVIIVPREVRKYSFEHILLPVRPLLSVVEKYDAVRTLLLAGKPAVTLLNLRKPDDANELHIIHYLTTIVRRKLENDGIRYTMEYYFKDRRFAEKVLASINEPEQPFDLVVISSEADIQDGDFHVGYYTQKMIHNCTIPVLILNSDNPRLTSSQILTQLKEEIHHH